MKNQVLIVLGSPNSEKGLLSDISISRLKYCLSIYTPEKLVLCTGGWGKQFNTTQQPHAAYAKKYLIKKGVSENDFLEMALSSNTVDDAVKIKPIIEPLNQVNLTIITSDYHLDRVKLIFNTILNTFKINYIGVNSHFLDKVIYNSLVNHEKKAVQAIRENGLYY